VGGVEGCFKGAVEGSVLGGGAARAAGGRGEGLLAEGGGITVKRDLAETAGSVRAAKRKASDGLILGPTRKSARCAAQRGLVAGMQALPVRKPTHPFSQAGVVLFISHVSLSRQGNLFFCFVSCRSRYRPFLDVGLYSRRASSCPRRMTCWRSFSGVSPARRRRRITSTGC